ncbi:MAG: hypothetical protein VXW83_09905, partial [SAR324 cluster bacterium]|nr:hypothetical protein [SAR324 cluster bacterium]
RSTFQGLVKIGHSKFVERIKSKLDPFLFEKINVFDENPLINLIKRLVSSPKANAVLYFADAIPWISAFVLNRYQGIPIMQLNLIDSPKSHPMKLAVDTFSVSLFRYL